ncbi:helix-turn-helix transcriptional regulator [Curtobacterium sp. PhB115]|uniref:helix-turn-helix transcriptional regulator n=1 Tax=Curtobacterium sp. PhB115 TaxID=2485173 RepID=UPI000FA26D9D|nr:helix-turn-helix transcriptional regulator [Curtobacterium sp. PhB115]ROP74027.1 AraC-like DNA-binding protein [Curtobacterium sp. PhB115]
MLTAVHGTDDARTVTVRVDDVRRRTEHSGTERGFAARVLAGAGHGHHVVFDTDHDRFRFRYRTRRDGCVSLVTASATSGFRGVFEPIDRVLVGWSASGGIRIGVEGTTVLETRPGVPVLMPTVGTFTVDAPAGTLQLVSIDRPLVDEARAGKPAGSHRLPQHGAEVESGALAELRHSVEVVAAAVADDDARARARFAAQTALVDAVLLAFGSPDAADADGPRLEMPSTVELAEAYLDGHCRAVLTLTDICGAVGVSPRTLQTSFMRQYGVSPMTFLQGMRLDRAHAALQSADRHDTSVGEVAQEWGFRHLGRFSGNYLRRFGEYPGETLRGATGRRAG